jgi:photosystem II stability/assembly factor-like uncharacterized protein
LTPHQRGRRLIWGGRHRPWGPVIAAAALVVPVLLTGTTGASGAGNAPQPLMITPVPGSTTLYVVASIYCSKAPCLRLYRTTVTAATFTPVALPPIGSSAGTLTGTLSHLVFASSEVGFAVVRTKTTNAIYATYDGARTWHRRAVTVSGVIESIAPTSSALYAEIAVCAATVAYCQRFRIARSPLTSDRWTSAPLPVNRSSSPGTFFGPVAANGADVWVNEIASHAYVARSTNSGRSFSLIASPELGSVAGCSLTATSPTTVWALCPTGMLESFWYTNDAARSWTYVVTPHAVAGTGGGLFDPVSPDLAYLAMGGATNPVERITNSARTTATVGRIGCASLLALTFTDEEHGLAVCNLYSVSSLEATSDGGARWRRAAITPS